MNQRIPVKGKRRLDFCETNRICSACGKPLKEGVPAKRGCHEYCYRILIASDYTDKELVEAGRLRPKLRGGEKAHIALVGMASVCKK